eukprot:122762-Chlamydomonas_euryale.AAC.4
MAAQRTCKRGTGSLPGEGASAGPLKHMLSETHISVMHVTTVTAVQLPQRPLPVETPQLDCPSVATPPTHAAMTTRQSLPLAGAVPCWCRSITTAGPKKSIQPFGICCLPCGGSGSNGVAVARHEHHFVSKGVAAAQHEHYCGSKGVAAARHEHHFGFIRPVRPSCEMYWSGTALATIHVLERGAAPAAVHILKRCSSSLYEHHASDGCRQPLTLPSGANKQQAPRRVKGAAHRRRCSSPVVVCEQQAPRRVK